MELNEQWIQFGYINNRGKINKSPIKFPFHSSLEIDEEFEALIKEQPYTFTCVAEEKLTNNDGSVDLTYIVSTNLI